MVPPGGATLPSVAEKATPTGGTKVVSDGTALSELWVMSAVTVEVPPGVIWFGDALTPRTIHGLKSRPAPDAVSQPVPPGPALQPHQLFWTSIVSAPV